MRLFKIKWVPWHKNGYKILNNAAGIRAVEACWDCRLHICLSVVRFWFASQFKNLCMGFACSPCVFFPAILWSASLKHVSRLEKHCKLSISVNMTVNGCLYYSIRGLQLTGDQQGCTQSLTRKSAGTGSTYTWHRWGQVAEVGVSHIPKSQVVTFKFQESPKLTWKKKIKQVKLGPHQIFSKSSVKSKSCIHNIYWSDDIFSPIITKKRIVSLKIKWTFTMHKN